MPFLPPGHANLQFISTNLANQTAMTAIGLELASAVPDDVIADAHAVWDAEFAPIVSDTWDGQVIRLTLGTSNPSAPLVFEYGPWTGGSNSSDPLPANCSYLIKKQTALGGRSGRGRMFLYGPTETGVDAYGRLSTSNLADIQSRCADFLTGLQGISGVAAVELLHETNVPGPTEITALVCDARIATQRRRMRD